MKHLTVALTAALSLAALTGCSAAQAAAPTAIASQDRPITVQAALQLLDSDGYGLQAVKVAYRLSDVNHVTLKLQKQVSGTFLDVAGASFSLSNAALSASPRAPIAFKSLRMNTSYKVVAKAFATASDDETIAGNRIDNGIDAQSSVTFNTSALSVVTPAANSDTADNVEEAYSLSVPVKLIDKTFAGQATSGSGVTVNNGSIVDPTGNETIQ